MAERKPFLDPDHPMFAKAWVRWLTTLAPLVWGGFEFWQAQPMWGLLFVAAGAYAGWTLIYKR
jgi:hypothetical protein